jgi:cell fate regulator YaaT (PSP1 superfamily)
MKQVGVRDEAKLIGGIGPCGMALCCSTYLREFSPVNVKMAKEQNLAMNPSKISGVCGRLMCCLAYECGIYQEAAKEMHKKGKRVMTEMGPGKVTDVNVLKKLLTIGLDSGGNVTLSTDKVIPLKAGLNPEKPETKQGKNGNGED